MATERPRVPRSDYGHVGEFGGRRRAGVVEELLDGAVLGKRYDGLGVAQVH